MTRRNLIASVLLLSALGQPVCAADLININTADSTTLESLNGIGASKAQAIIDYRTQHGPFATIADIQNVSGIGPATYANIKDFITVDGTTATQTQIQTQSQDQSSSTPAQSQVEVQTSGGASPPPITAQISTDALALVGAGTLFSGTAFGSQGEPLIGARYLWNFGDGATAEGAKVWHTYAYPGTYAVMLSVANGFSSATARAAINAAPASVALVAEGDGSLTIANQSDYDLDIGLWSLKEGTSTFVIPEGTMLLRGKGVRFSPVVLKFAGDESTKLYYQNGSFAAGAVTGANSPLRGQVVEIADEIVQPSAQIPSQKSALAPASALSAAPTSTQNGDLAAAAAVAAAPLSSWMYLAGLVALIMVGAVGTYYAYPAVSKRDETIDPADEFEIEE